MIQFFMTVKSIFKKFISWPLLAHIVIAIVLAILSSLFFPTWLSRVFVTINSIFSNFLGFIIPLLIVGLVAPGISDLGNKAGKLLFITVLIAYISTCISGYMSYGTCRLVYPYILSGTTLDGDLNANLELLPYFTIEMKPIMDVTSSLVLAFVLGLAIASVNAKATKSVLDEFKDIIMMVISKVIIPLLPLFIYGIFLKLSVEGMVVNVIGIFIKIIAVIFVMHIFLLLFQFIIAGAYSGKNPFKAPWNMMPAYMTALGTQSSAATIPITLRQTKMNGVSDEVAEFQIPLCATVHLAGSILKIVASCYAISMLLGMPTDIGLYSEFILMLGLTMVAAPGVPGGAIMAALALISGTLGFDSQMQGIVIAIYISIDSFGTAANVTGDGAIALIIDKISKKNEQR